MKKAAILHDIISDRLLDVLAIQDSWMQPQEKYDREETIIE